MHFFVVYKLHFIVANVNIPESIAGTCIKSLRSIIIVSAFDFHWFIIDLPLIAQFI